MVIVRYEPEAIVSFDGTYALVGHYGEPTSVLIWCRKGERLPFVAGGDTVVTPAWFVRLTAESSMRVAA